MSLVQKIKNWGKEQFYPESPIIFQSCEHLEFERLPHGLIMCKRCHRTYRWELGIFGSDQIKISKKHLDKLLKLREDATEGSMKEK